MILAVDMGGTRWKAAVMDRGRVVVFDSLPHSSSVNSLTDLASLFERMLESAGCSLSDVLGLGISLPEIVDADAKFCPSPCFKHPYLEGKNVEDVVYGDNANQAFLGINHGHS